MSLDSSQVISDEAEVIGVNKVITVNSLRYEWHSRVHPYQVATDQAFDIDDDDFCPDEVFEIIGKFSVLSPDIRKAEPIEGLTTRAEGQRDMVDVYELSI